MCRGMSGLDVICGAFRCIARRRRANVAGLDVIGGVSSCRGSSSCATSLSSCPGTSPGATSLVGSHRVAGRRSNRLDVISCRRAVGRRRADVTGEVSRRVVERHQRAPLAESLVVLCDVAGLGVIGCACLAGGTPCPSNAAGALAEVDSLKDVAVAAFQALVWSGDGSGARRAFVPAAGAPVAKRPAAHEAIGLPGVRDHGIGPAGAGARQALGASVPPHLTIIYLAQRPWQGISSPSGGKVPSGSHQAAPRRNLCCWTWWSSPWGPGSLPGGGGF